MGSNIVQSLNFFRSFSSSVMAAFACPFLHHCKLVQSANSTYKLTAILARGYEIYILREKIGDAHLRLKLTDSGFS